MKGITHFTVGVAVASCLPGTVAAAAAGNPLYFVLGGVCGLLPDTLDFKVTRFFYRTDMTVRPDPLHPDMQTVADAIALAMQRVRVGRSPVTLRLDTVRLGADCWQRYTIRFDVHDKQVRVALGPVVDTGGNPVDGRIGDAERLAHSPAGTARVHADLKLSYLAAMDVDIFDGPVLRFLPAEGDGVEVEFLPWHRAWTHSLLVGALVGVVGGLAWGPLAGLVMAGAYAAHAAVDQLGYMGSNLLAPVTRRRTPGFKLAHAGDALANFCGVWIACTVTVCNLVHAARPDTWLDPLRIAVVGIILPCTCFGLLDRWRRRE